MAVSRKIFWPLIFITLTILSYMVVNNTIELPFHDQARDIVNTGTEDGIEVGYDKDGNIVYDWSKNNPIDDVIKAALVGVTVFSFWQVLSLFIRSRITKILLVLGAIPIACAIIFFIALATW